MKKPVIRLLALVLLSALLAGCGQLSGPAQELLEIIQQESGEGTVTFDQMVYTRPDLEEMENILARPVRRRQGKTSERFFRVFMTSMMSTTLSIPIMRWRISTTVPI